MVVIKDNKEMPYDSNKIRRAIIQAANQIKLPDFDFIDSLTNEITTKVVMKGKNAVSNSEIENIVMSVLYDKAPDIARQYSNYKIDKERAKKNPTEIEKVLYVNDDIKYENGNKNPNLVHIKNAYLAEIPSKEMLKKLLPKDCWDAHERSIVYFNDSAYSARNLLNCCLWNLEDMFKGCAINSTYIETPKSFRTACTVASQALTMATSSQFGGITINLLHLAKFVDVSRKKIETEVEEEIHLMLDNFCDNEKSNFDVEKVKTKMVNKRLQKEIEDGIQTFLYQTNTLCSGTGQAAFLSVGCWLSEDPKYSDDLIMVYKELIKQRLKGMRQEDGTYANPNFPKILYVLDKDTMKGGKYYEITKLSAKCSAQRLVPDYLGLKKHLKLKGVLTFPMGCRSLLNSYQDDNGNYITWGRANMGVQTLNLPYIAMENNKKHSEEILFKNLEHYLEIAQRDMLWRANHIAKIKAKDNPLALMYGGYLRLKPEDTLEKYVYSGYFTISLGYAGLREAVYYITGEDQFHKSGNKLAHKILDFLNEKNNELREKTGIAAGLYGTPILKHGALLK